MHEMNNNQTKNLPQYCIQAIYKCLFYCCVLKASHSTRYNQLTKTLPSISCMCMQSCVYLNLLVQGFIKVCSACVSPQFSLLLWARLLVYCLYHQLVSKPWDIGLSRQFVTEISISFDYTMIMAFLVFFSKSSCPVLFFLLSLYAMDLNRGKGRASD